MSAHDDVGISTAKADNYASARGAAAYRDDHRDKLHRRWSDRVERRILRGMLAELGRVESLLDVPCGHGRLFDLLQAHARTVIAADWSPSMLTLHRTDNAAAGSRRHVRCSALALPFPDRAVDVVVSVRLSHHLEAEADRERHLRELCRVARRGVIATFFSFHSVKNTLRRLRRPLDGKAPKRTLRRATVAEVAADCGFSAARFAPLSRLASGHVYALLVRDR